jgi:hypothetical protein
MAFVHDAFENIYTDVLRESDRLSWSGSTTGAYLVMMRTGAMRTAHRRRAYTRAVIDLSSPFYPFWATIAAVQKQSGRPCLERSIIRGAVRMYTEKERRGSQQRQRRIQMRATTGAKKRHGRSEEAWYRLVARQSRGV